MGGQEINPGAKIKIGGAVPPTPPRWRRAWGTVPVPVQLVYTGSLPYHTDINIIQFSTLVWKKGLWSLVHGSDL